MSTNLNVRINNEKKTRRFLIELDADKFERLAAGLGLFNDEFLNSVERAERDIAKKKIKKIKSLRDLSK